MQAYQDETGVQPLGPGRLDKGSHTPLGGAWPLAILLLLATLPYVGVLRNDFAYAFDDKSLIFDNPYTHSFRYLPEAFTTTLFSYLSVQHEPPYYRPMATVGFMVCYRIFGPMAYGFHLVSLLLHAAVVLMLFLMAARLLGDRVAAFAAAGLFAVHPIHIESIAWISTMTDLEVTFFYLLTFWCFLQVAGPGGGRRPWAQAAMTVSFLLALLSREQAITLPFLAVIYEHFCRDDRAQTTRAQKGLRYGVLWILSMGYILMRVHILGSVGRASGWYHLTLRETILSAFALLGQYFFKLLWPAHLSAFVFFHPSTHLWNAQVLGGVSGLILCGVVFGVLWRSARPASLGILWLLGTLAPVLNANWMAVYALAERYLYLPSVGFCLVAGWTGAALWRAASRRQGAGRWAVVAGACIVTALCVLRIVTRIPDWRDDVTLVSRALAAEPDDFILHNGLGYAYWMRGDWALAEQEWKESLRIQPTFIRPIIALGALCAKQHRYGEAMGYLQLALQLDPRDADTHLNLGALYAETGSLDRAEDQFRAAVSLSPLDFAAHNVLGKLYFDSARLDLAEQQFRQSLKCELNLAALDYLGYVYQRRGDRVAAEKAFQAALALNGADSHAHFNLGLIYAAAGQKARAVQEFQAALAADPNNSEIQSALEQAQR